MSRASRFVLLCVVWTGMSACSSTLDAPLSDPVHIILSVSGGIAGVDWQVTIDGATGRVIGDRCRARLACDWDPGEVLANVAPGDLDTVAEEFADRGFFEGETDFGSECCDQFDYRLTYIDRDDNRTVSGSDTRLPNHIRDLIEVVGAFVEAAREGRVAGG